MLDFCQIFGPGKKRRERWGGRLRCSGRVCVEVAAAAAMFVCAMAAGFKWWRRRARLLGERQVQRSAERMDESSLFRNEHPGEPSTGGSSSARRGLANIANQVLCTFLKWGFLMRLLLLLMQQQETRSLQTLTHPLWHTHTHTQSLIKASSFKEVETKVSFKIESR